MAMSSTSRASMTVPTPTVSDFLGTYREHKPERMGESALRHLLNVVVEKSGTKTRVGGIRTNAESQNGIPAVGFDGLLVQCFFSRARS